MILQITGDTQQTIFFSNLLLERDLVGVPRNHRLLHWSSIYGKADNQWYIKPRGMYVRQTSAVCEAIHRYAPKFYQHGHFATQTLLVVRTSLATYNFHL